MLILYFANSLLVGAYMISKTFLIQNGASENTGHDLWIIDITAD